MKAALYTSADFDNLAQIIADLSAGLPEAQAEPTLGLLFCDSQADSGGLAAALAEQVSFPIVGGTSLAFPFTAGPGTEPSAALLTLAGPGLRCGIAVSEPLEAGKAAEQMCRTLRRALESLEVAPALFMVFAPLMPGVNTNDFISELFALADGVPVFGGVTTGDLISTKAAVFAEGRAFGDRLALVALGGEIKPVFAVQNLVTRMSEYSPEVTRSAGAEVSRVDDLSVCDYLRGLGLKPEDRVNGVDALMQYGPIPVQVRVPGREDDGVPEVRCISFTNLAEGSAMFSGAIPVGARLSVSLLSPENVVDSAAQCLDQLRARMAANAGYEYGCILCVSCVARYFVLSGGENGESALLSAQAPPLAGIYGFCEICPTLPEAAGGQPGSSVHNRSHSAAIAMLAL